VRQALLLRRELVGHRRGTRDEDQQDQQDAPVNESSDRKVPCLRSQPHHGRNASSVPVGETQRRAVGRPVRQRPGPESTKPAHSLAAARSPGFGSVPFGGSTGRLTSRSKSGPRSFASTGSALGLRQR